MASPLLRVRQEHTILYSQESPDRNLQFFQSVKSLFEMYRALVLDCNQNYFAEMDKEIVEM